MQAWLEFFGFLLAVVAVLGGIVLAVISLVLVVINVTRPTRSTVVAGIVAGGVDLAGGGLFSLMTLSILLDIGFSDPLGTFGGIGISAGSCVLGALLLGVSTRTVKREADAGVRQDRRGDLGEP